MPHDLSITLILLPDAVLWWATQTPAAIGPLSRRRRTTESMSVGIDSEERGKLLFFDRGPPRPLRARRFDSRATPFAMTSRPFGPQVTLFDAETAHERAKVETSHSSTVKRGQECPRHVVPHESVRTGGSILLAFRGGTRTRNVSSHIGCPNPEYLGLLFASPHTKSVGARQRKSENQQKKLGCENENENSQRGLFGLIRIGSGWFGYVTPTPRTAGAGDGLPLQGGDWE